jgi:hypothetical protein
MEHKTEDTAVQHEPATKTPVLPSIIATPAEVSRLNREIAQLDDVLHQFSLRTGGGATELPKTSRLLEILAENNQLNLLSTDDRRLLRRFLELVEQRAPKLHFSFSADPSPAFIDKLINWLRQEIHPQALVVVGLQPNIGAGCTLRTVNKYFDLSMKKDFYYHRGLLKRSLWPEDMKPA